MTTSFLTNGQLLLLLPDKYTSASLQHIIDASDCRIFLRGGDVAMPSINTSDITFVSAPEETELLASSPTKPYQYEPKFPEVLNDPSFVIHTSGSSGKQKVRLRLNPSTYLSLTKAACSEATRGTGDIVWGPSRSECP